MKNRVNPRFHTVREITNSHAFSGSRGASGARSRAADQGLAQRNPPVSSSKLRAIFFLLLLVSGCAGWPFATGPAADLDGDPEQVAARILARAIRFDTQNPPGDERPLAEYLVGLLRAEGIEARVVPTPSEGSPAGRAAAWARVPGRGAARPIVLLSHLDVVPARREEWAFGPFEGAVGGGHVVGRGALDAKGIAVVHLLALAQIARRSAPLERDVILLAVPDEETGGRSGSGWLAEERRDLLGSAEFMLAEGGAILPGQGSGPDLWGVAFSEKNPCWIELVARGRGGHGSAASGDGAIPTLVAALERVRRMRSPLRVTPEVAQMFAALAPYAAPEDRAGLARLEEALAVDAEFRARFLAERGRAALVKNTLEITVLEGGSSTNVVPAEARAEIDARLLPGERCEDFVEEVRDAAATPDLELRVLLDFESRASRVDTELFRALERVAARSERPAVVVPRVISGFTDAHYFRDLGIVAYGFVPRWLDSRDTRGIHGPNERISLENLTHGVRVLVEILEELDRP
jgi:acetylornithine deacetylase/succinyl-diaminopimelate desuccinylase-like protein